MFRVRSGFDERLAKQRPVFEVQGVPFTWGIMQVNASVLPGNERKRMASSAI